MVQQHKEIFGRLRRHFERLWYILLNLDNYLTLILIIFFLHHNWQLNQELFDWILLLIFYY